jgi:uncharacterized protein
MRQAGEPSVEEILESIKKVIARDNRADAAEARAERVDSTDLTGEEADEDGVLDLAALDVAEEPGEPAPLLADEAVSSISDSLAALAMLSQPPAAPQIVRSGETSLEGLTRELLRPALAEWLDQNLPALVEKLVAAEIARIVSKKG